MAKEIKRRQGVNDHSTVKIPYGVLETVAVYREVCKVADRYNEETHRTFRFHGLGDPVCSGCKIAGCCHQPVIATFLDTMAIALACERSGQNTKEFRDDLRAIGKEHLKATIAGPPLIDQGWECPFLLDGKCRVYEVRPIVCRTYWAFVSQDPCTPFERRTDGKQPRTTTNDTTPIMHVALKATLDVARQVKMGGFYWLNVLPLQVSGILEAFASSEDFWSVVAKRCQMTKDQFDKAVLRQLKNAENGFSKKMDLQEYSKATIQKGKKSR